MREISIGKAIDATRIAALDQRRGYWFVRLDCLTLDEVAFEVIDTAAAAAEV